MTELLPAPNSVSSRAETAADSELASSQPPADRADEVWVASSAPAMAMTTAIRDDGTAEAVDERSPAAEHRDPRGTGDAVDRSTIENDHSFCQARMVASRTKLR